MFKRCCIHGWFEVTSAVGALGFYHKQGNRAGELA